MTLYDARLALLPRVFASANSSRYNDEFKTLGVFIASKSHGLGETIHGVWALQAARGDDLVDIKGKDWCGIGTVHGQPVAVRFLLSSSQ